jgi:hypothetical protein
MLSSLRRQCEGWQGVPCETVPVGFTEVSRIMGGAGSTFTAESDATRA